MKTPSSRTIWWYTLWLLGILIWIFFLFAAKFDPTLSFLFPASLQNNVVLDTSLKDTHIQPTTSTTRFDQTNLSTAWEPSPQNTSTSQSQTDEQTRISLLQDIYDSQLDQAQISLDTVRSLLQDSSQLATYDIQNHKAMYQKTKDKQVLASLVVAYAHEFDFEQAYEALRLLWADYSTYLSADIVAHVLLNSPLIQYNNSQKQYVLTSLEAMNKKGLLSNDTWLLYQWILSVLDWNTDTMQTYFNQIRSDEGREVRDAIASVRASRQQQSDVPAYYLQWLISLKLLEHWYFKIAQQLAVHVLTRDENYILPYQILGYTHFIMHDWEVSSEYFRILQWKDPENIPRYAFMLGVSLYRQKKHQESIIALKKNTQLYYPEDTLRYLILNYKQLDDTTNTFNTFKNLLAYQNALTVSDYYVFFETVLFAPFVEQQPFTIYKTNTYLTQEYINACLESLATQDHYICRYGQAGVLLAENKLDQAWRLLFSLAQDFPKSYIFHALWDWYLRNQQLENAKQAYIKALSLSASDVLKKSSKQKIFNIVELMWE